jgi:hypothetical protein
MMAPVPKIIVLSGAQVVAREEASIWTIVVAGPPSMATLFSVAAEPR